MGVKVNSVEEYEPILVTLDEYRFPIAHKNKVDELIESGAFDSVEEAKKWVNNTPIELEIYYEKDYGLFAVESEAITSGSICSPYSREYLEEN